MEKQNEVAMNIDIMQQISPSLVLGASHGNELPYVSIVIVNTNELHHLQRCLPSIAAQIYPHYEVLIVDNCSTDGSLEYVETEFPWIMIVRNQQNLGYAGANNVGFAHAAGQYIAVLNPDTRVEPGWLKALVQALEDDPSAGLGTPKILLMDKPTHINACGNEITLTGLTFCRGLDEGAHNYSHLEYVSAVSGAAFIIRRSVLEEIGGFDETFFIYYEETDLCLRAMLAGHRVLYVPNSIVYHQYSFRFSAKKGFMQERNRYYSLFKTLQWRTLFALLPTLLIGELLAWGYAVLKGPEHLWSKVQTYTWLFQSRTQILTARCRTQQLRRVKDQDIVRMFGHRLTFAQTTKPWLIPILDMLFQPMVYLLGSMSRHVIRW
jgi:GT2 family glycosyltransferase